MGSKGSDKKTQSVRFPMWMVTAIEGIAKKGGFTFTEVVIDLLRQELSFMGYTMGIGREATQQKSDKPLLTKDPAPTYDSTPPETGLVISEDSIGYDMVGVLYLGECAATAAGELREMLNNTGDYEVRYFPNKLIKKPERCFCINVIGTSMTKAGIDDGDEVLLERTEEPENGAIMLVSYEGESSLKRVIIKNGRVFLRWEDGSNKEDEIKKEGYEVLAKHLYTLKPVKKLAFED